MSVRLLTSHPIMAAFLEPILLLVQTVYQSPDLLLGALPTRSMVEDVKVIVVDTEANILAAVVGRHTGQILVPGEDAERLATSAIIA